MRWLLELLGARREARVLRSQLAPSASQLAPLLLLIAIGCTQGTERERALAAVSVAVASATCDVITWTGELPLSGELLGARREALALGSQPAPRASQLAPSAQRLTPTINWRRNFAEAVRESGKTGKPVLAHCMSSSCGPCRQLERTIFRDLKFIKAINTQFVAVKVNETTHPKLADELGVAYVPTDYVLVVDGSRWRSVYRNEGAPRNTKSYLAALKVYLKAAHTNRRS